MVVEFFGVSIYNSTSGSAGGYNPNVTTAVWQNTTSIPASPIPSGHKTEWNVRLSSGMVINKVGNADINILWDFEGGRHEQRIKKITPFNASIGY